jgi:hypothetical protein
MRRTLEISGILLAVLLTAMTFHAWLASHDDRLTMQATIATQKQLLDAADARERTRAATLKDSLAEIETLKRSAQTPAQILRDLPKYLSLPQPITLTPSSTANATKQKGTAPSGKSVCAEIHGCPAEGASPPIPSASVSWAPSPIPPHRSPPAQAQDLPEAPSAQIPVVDLKPLYDYVQDCRSCQVQLAAAKQDSVDNAAKLSALTHERDAALTAAKGGTLWLRLRRNALWFAIGAGAGVAAACGTGHCR